MSRNTNMDAFKNIVDELISNDKYNVSWDYNRDESFTIYIENYEELSKAYEEGKL